MRKLNSVPGKRIFRGSKVTCARLTPGQTYVVTDIYSNGKNDITVDLRLSNGRNSVASVSADDVLLIMQEGTRYVGYNLING